jgi:2-dehydropantoate 2-reductase
MKKNQQADSMTVLIYGAGAVGLGIASCLLKADVRTEILARSQTAEALRKYGLKRTGIFGEVFISPSDLTVYERMAPIPSDRFDLILVCTKSSDSQAAANELADRRQILRRNGKIILFQNGWGNAEIFARRFPQEMIYNARVITGFIRPQPSQVEVTVHADAIHIGSLFKQPTAPLEWICEQITAGGIPCQTTAEIGKDLWAKMLYNCALNPLGAILDVPYGTLAKFDSTREIMNHLIEETFSVMRAAGFTTHWDTAEAFRRVFYDRLVPATADHRSSTLQDLKAGKKTEIDALTGAVLRLAESQGQSIPYSRFLYQVIQFIQSQGQTDTGVD